MSDRSRSILPSTGTALLAAALAVLTTGLPGSVASAADGPAAEITPLILAYAQVPTPAPVQWAAVRYVPEPQARPKPASPKAPHQTKGASQIHGGLYDPENVLGTRANAGFRAGPMVTRNLQVGIGVDWMYDSENLTTGSGGISVPGGPTVAVQQVLSRASLHQVPIMAYAQFEGWGLLWLVPYVGASGGYQFMFITADNYATNEHLEATLGGWAWQTWGGIGVPLGNRVRATTEVFLHGGEVARITTDAATGQAYRETASTDGVGVRFGLAFGM